MTVAEISWKPWYRGRFTVAIEELESTENKLVLRVWTTKWDEVFEWLQKGGTSIALLSVLGLTPLATLTAGEAEAQWFWPDADGRMSVSLSFCMFVPAKS